MPEINYLYHLIQTSAPPVWGTGDDDYRPANFQHVGNGVYSQASKPGDSPPEVLSRPEMAGATLIGTWGRYGDSVAHDEAAYLAICPLGNALEQVDENGKVILRAGAATGPLHAASFGEGQYRLSDLPGRAGLYPANLQPTELHIHRTTDGFLVSLVELTSSSAIETKRMAAYADAACTKQTGISDPFKIIAPTEPDGEPTIQTELKTTDNHMALINADGTQEGFTTVSGGSVTRLFWKVNQDGTTSQLSQPIPAPDLSGLYTWSQDEIKVLLDGLGVGYPADADKIKLISLVPKAYHATTHVHEDTPSNQNTRAEIKAWLDKHGVSYDSNMTKNNLLYCVHQAVLLEHGLPLD